MNVTPIFILLFLILLLELVLYYRYDIFSRIDPEINPYSNPHCETFKTVTLLIQAFTAMNVVLMIIRNFL